MCTLCTLAASCTPPTRQTPTPTPTSTTPTETQLERETRLAFEAAEKAYRANWAEVGRLSMAGGVTEPTKVMTDTATGKYLKRQLDDLRYLKENDYRTKKVGSVRVMKLGAFKHRELRLIACEDFRGVFIFDEDGKKVPLTSPGTRVYMQTIIVTKANGVWKLFDYASRQVKSCSN